MIVAVNDGTGLQYLLTDHPSMVLRTVPRLNGGSHRQQWNTSTSSVQALTSQQRYLPFGEERAIPNSPILATDFGYTGQRLLDSGMGGIMDYRARFYSPQLGRFIQPDSIIPGPTNPQSWNRFSYVMNNPIRFTDPSGHACVDGTSYCVDPVARKKSGSLTSYNDTYTGGNGRACYKCSVFHTPDPDVGLSLGLHPESCAANACSLPPDLSNNDPDASYCQNGVIGCSPEINIETPPFDIGVLVIKLDSQTTVTSYSSGQPVLLSQSGISVGGLQINTDGVASDVDLPTLNVYNTTITPKLGSSINTDGLLGAPYTSMNFGVETSTTFGNVQYDHTEMIEVGVRPVESLMLVLVPALRKLKIPIPKMPTFPDPELPRVWQ